MANKLKDSIYQIIKCPITLSIMNDPVIASDGITYERQAIEKYMEQNNHSPITRNALKPELIPAIGIKNIIDDFINTYPDSKSDQYEIIKTLHLDNESHVKLLFKEKKYHKLQNYIGFDLITCGKYVNFYHFIRNANDDQIIYFIGNCIDPNATVTDNNDKIIHKIALCSRSTIACYLLENNIIDVNVLNIQKIKPLHLILKYCDIKAIELFIKKTSNKNIVTKNGNYPIHFLMKNTKLNDDEMIEIFKTFDNLNKKNKKTKMLPIHLACKYLKKKTIIYLINNHAIICDKNNNDKYPYHYVVENTNIKDNEKLEIFDLMPNLNSGTPDVNKFIYDIYLNCSYELIYYFTNKKINNEYPIHALLKNKKLVEDQIIELLSMIDNFDLTDDQGNTIMHIACNRKLEKIIAFLMKQNININHVNNAGNCPIHCYLNNSVIDFNIIKLFISKGANINAETPSGLKPIHLVASKYTIGILKYMLDNGATADNFNGADSDSESVTNSDSNSDSESS